MQFVDEVRAMLPIVGLEAEARLIAKVEIRERIWRRYVSAEASYQSALHQRVTGRYGAERRDREVEAARAARDRYARELGL